jgi:UDP-4-amino-4,6-dideoxy-L-N-acetyl-beta-L-altrosamine transaminase
MNDLAINGGKPTLSYKLEYSSPRITAADKKAVMDAMDSEWIAGRGKIVRDFEEALALYTGFKYAVAANSATSGLFLACDLVTKPHTIPSLTFVATMNAPLLNGNEVKIVDVDPVTFVANDATIPVSYAGYPVETGKDGLIKVVDDAHSLRRNMADRYSKRTISVISTHAIKPITTGEGGVMLTNSKELADHLRGMSDHGHWNSTSYGHNFRMSSIQAALGLSQLESAQEMFWYRKEIAAVYRNALRDNPLVKLQQDHLSHSNHIFPLILDSSIDRNWFREALLAEGVKTQIHYQPLHLIARTHSEWSRIDEGGKYPVTMSMWNHGFSLPMHNDLGPGEARKVMEAFEKILNHVKGN